MTQDDVDAYVAGRLSGTVWASSTTAKTLYGRCMTAGRRLGELGITPNALTYGSLVLALLAGAAVATGHLLTAATILLLSGLFDVLDGMVARATGRATKFGALLDSTVDRFSDALPLLGLVILLSSHGWWVGVPAAAMLGAVSVSYVRARAESLGAKLPPLFMRRAERLVLLVITLLLGGLAWNAPARFGGELGWAQVLLLTGLGLMAVLSFAAAAVALRAAQRALEGEGSLEAGGAPNAEREDGASGDAEPGAKTDPDSSALRAIRFR